VDLEPAAPCGGDVAGFMERGRQITSRHPSASPRRSERLSADIDRHRHRCLVSPLS
jgi:hypothetical protein